MTFESIEIQPEIVKGLKEMGITSPTEIQRKAIPLMKSGHDVIGWSKTGSGKTIAFGVPILERLGKGLSALIIAPTRELAVQIADELQKLSKYRHCRIATVYGGVSIGPQMKQIQTCNIVVGTPGRLLDHLQRGTLKLSGIKQVVLDEADKMVEMGFINDIERILDYTPKEKQVMLFGATMSDEIGRVKQRYMHDVMTVEAEKHVHQDLLKQYYYDVPSGDKFSLLVHLFGKEKVERAIIFCSTRHTVDIVARNLRDHGIKAGTLHGRLTQNKRLDVMRQFNDGKVNILVASAVAARGLDLKDVTHVFNFDLSKDPKEYIHRVGRTARAGEAGRAITLLSDRDHDVFTDILRNYPVSIEVLPRENYPRLPFKARMERRPFRGNSPRNFGGRRFGSGGSRPRRSNSSGGFRRR